MVTRACRGSFRRELSEQRGLWNGRFRVLHDDEPTWCILSDRMQSGTLFDYARTIDGRPGMIPLED